MADPINATAVERQERWTFERLVQCKPLMNHCDKVLEEFRDSHEKLYKKTGFHHRFEWCILVDNSGSMITKVGARILSIEFNLHTFHFVLPIL